jgi:hypothetical protein
MGERIKARREAIGQNTIFGLLDGDFVADFSPPTNQPATWNGSDGLHLGWRWERNEIENYLVDPEVVCRALRADASFETSYRAAVQQSRDTIAVYQAARIALSINRRRFLPMANCFGPQRGRLAHPFPDTFDKVSCLNGIRQVVSEYQNNSSVSEASSCSARISESGGFLGDSAGRDRSNDGGHCRLAGRMARATYLRG